MKLDKTIRPFRHNEEAGKQMSQQKTVERRVAQGKPRIWVQYTGITPEKFEQILFNYSLLRLHQIMTPEIYVQNSSTFQVVMQDLGSEAITSELVKDGQKILPKVKDTLTRLMRIQESPEIALPIMGFLEIQKRVMFAYEWTNRVMLNSTYNLKSILPSLIRMAEQVSRIPKSLSHNDFRSQNLFFTENQIYLIDLEHLCFGPIFYDLASFLNDPNLAGLELDWLADELFAEFGEVGYRACSFFNNFYALGTYQFILDKLEELDRKHEFDRYIRFTLNRLFNETRNLSEPVLEDFIFQLAKVKENDNNF